MKTVTIKNDYEQAVEAFNNELNDYFEREIENVRPYSNDNAMLSYVNEFEDALNDGTDLTWELGKKTRTGYVASFTPSDEWQEKHLEIDDGKEREMFEVLDNLRDSGKINMFGSPSVIAEVFGLDKKQSREVVTAWMESFKGNKSKEGSK